MKRRIGLGGIVSVLTLALLLPSTALGAYAPYRSVVLRAACTTSGGLYGYGKVVLKVEAFSYAQAGTNYFVFKTRRQEKIDGVWVTVERTTQQSAIFPDDTDPEYSFSAINKVKYAFPTASHPRTRLLTKIQFWDQRPGGDVLLAAHGHRTGGC
jgi:hypothetical protein